MVMREDSSSRNPNQIGLIMKHSRFHLVAIALILFVGFAFAQERSKPRIINTTDLGADPDSDSLAYSWSFYKEPSSYGESVAVENQSSADAKVSVPANAGGKCIHIVLEVHDDGAPNLYAYRRVIINVK